MSGLEEAGRFAQEDQVNTFYWINGLFGFAISAKADKTDKTDKTELAPVSGEVYR